MYDQPVPDQKPMPVTIVGKPTYWQPFLILLGAIFALLVASAFYWTRPLVALLVIAVLIGTTESPGR